MVISLQRLIILADYFNVTVDYLLGNEKDENVQYYLNDETREIAQEIFENKDLKILFDASRNANPEDLQLIIDMAKRFKGEDWLRKRGDIWMDNIRILYVDMPIGYRAFTMPKDDYYTIYLNSRYNLEQNINSLEHELTHIKNGDYDKDYPVDFLEFYAHSKNMKGI